MAEQRFHPVARYLHWMVAALIVLQFVLVKLAENAAAPVRELALLANHRSIGITILVLAALRLAWRQFQGIPRPLSTPAWQTMAARVSHWLMYSLIFVLPVTGWLLSSAAAASVSWFGLVPLPDMVAADPDLEATLESVHGSLAWLLLLLAAIHIGAALKHSVLDRHGAIARISSPGTLMVFAALIIAGVTLLIPAEPDPGAYARGAAETMPAASRANELPVWELDYERSFITLTVVRDGYSVDLDVDEWSAEIRFDEANLEASLIDANVAAAASASEGEPERSLQEEAGVNGGDRSGARYLARDFRQGPDGSFAAAGILAFDGQQTAMLLIFDVQHRKGRKILDGTAELDRLALPEGSGDSPDPRRTGREVFVVVHVETID